MNIKTIFIRGLFDIPDFSWHDYHQLKCVDFDIRTGLFQKYNGEIEREILKCFDANDNNIVLIGHSYGCFMIDNFVRSCKQETLDRIKGIVLINSVLKGRRIMNPYWPYYFSRPFLYTLARFMHVFNIPIYQGLQYSEWDFSNTAMPSISNYSEQKGYDFIQLLSSKKIRSINIMTHLSNKKIFNIWLPILWANTMLDMIVYFFNILMTIAVLFSSNDGIVPLYDQWLPESDYSKNITIVASHMDTVGTRLLCLGGRSRRTKQVEKIIKGFFSEIQ